MRTEVAEFYAKFEGHHFYKHIPMLCAPGVH